MNRPLIMAIAMALCVVIPATDPNVAREMSRGEISQRGEAASMVVPIAGSIDGFDGARFRTTLQLINPTARQQHGQLTFHEREDREGGVERRSIFYRLAPHASQHLPDLLASFGVRDFGTLELTSISGGLPLVVTRIVEDASPSGDKGQTIPAVALDDATGSGETTWLMVPPELEGLRLNIGARSVDEGTFFLVRTWGADGTLSGETFQAVGRERVMQLGAELFAGRPLTGGELLEIEVLSGRAWFYASLVDGRTGDSSLRLSTSPDRLIRASALHVPIAGSVTGAFNSRFRTELQLGNPFEHHLTGWIVAHPADPDEDSAIVPFLISPRTSFAIDSVFDELGLAGIGSLEIRPLRRPLPIVAATTVSHAGLGPHREGIPALVREEASGPGEVVAFATPIDASQRFNLGITTIGGAELLAEIELYDVDGALVEGPIQIRQRSGETILKPISSWFGNDVGGFQGVVLARIRNGEGIVFASGTDQLTGDVALQLVPATNTPPEVVTGEDTIRFEAAANGTTRRVLAARDPDGESLIAFARSGPSIGSLAIAPGAGSTFELAFEPPADFVGQAEWVLRIEDERGGFVDVAMEALVVATDNAEPQAVDAFAALLENTSLEITLRGLDDLGGPLLFEITAPPLRGSLGPIRSVDGLTATVLYTPETNYHGKDRIEFRVTDPGGRFDDGSIAIEISQQGELPPG